jgi:hypothetical protein
VLESGIGPLGALLAGLLATLTSTRLTLAVGVAGITLATLWLVFSPLRTLDGDQQSQMRSRQGVEDSAETRGRDRSHPYIESSNDRC